MNAAGIGVHWNCWETRYENVIVQTCLCGLHLWPAGFPDVDLILKKEIRCIQEHLEGVWNQILHFRLEDEQMEDLWVQVF